MSAAPSDDSSANSPALQDKSFVVLLALVTLAFAWILWPLYGALLWGTAAAIVFAPLHRWMLRRCGQRATLAALLTLSLVLLLVILPLTLVSIALAQEAGALYAKLKSGEFSFSGYVQQVYAALPAGLLSGLEKLGVSDPLDLQQKLTEALKQLSQAIATKAFGFGQDTFDVVVSFFVMLYLLFFLLRDGDRLSVLLRHALPLRAAHKRRLMEKFRAVIGATVKGNIAVAALQGALGGLAFWVLDVHAPVLWAVLMAFLSLLPAVGAGLVWLPLAIYLLATGAIGQGLGLIAYGVLVIGLVDNLLRPLLVGKDSKMPDYVVLVSTLGGMAVLGLNGFVIGPLIAAMFIAVWDIVAQDGRRSAPK
ncbi:AI-2E family transporter [Paucibacter sediminis]|uniref:AI-2E family transporter n=1 Tax=Paucibacter sediminis TaxID=3019553 RepID=A0AA95SL76_9BURK|nr:AI-2E family transporter [Paucibacter sp. S2-9]WIT09892.1 AI-2E family transporter [Paucibacter sp. S2-9]